MVNKPHAETGHSLQMVNERKPGSRDTDLRNSYIRATSAVLKASAKVTVSHPKYNDTTATNDVAMSSYERNPLVRV